MGGRAGQGRPLNLEVSMVFRKKRAKILVVAAVTGVAAALTVGLSAPSGGGHERCGHERCGHERPRW